LHAAKAHHAEGNLDVEFWDKASSAPFPTRLIDDKAYDSDRSAIISIAGSAVFRRRTAAPSGVTASAGAWSDFLLGFHWSLAGNIGVNYDGVPQPNVVVAGRA
jgi:hypothetical protein